MSTIDVNISAIRNVKIPSARDQIKHSDSSASRIDNYAKTPTTVVRNANFMTEQKENTAENESEKKEYITGDSR